MTIRLSWPSQADKALTSIEIYRKVGHSATIDVNNPGSPTATVAGDATQFVEDVANLTEKTVYTYWIAAVKGTERLFSAPIVQGFFLDTGPGPQKLLMGDWYAGYFGYVSNADFISRDDLVGSQGGLTPAQNNIFGTMNAVSGFSGWHKFVFKGRILFFQHGPGAYSTPAAIYNAGMVYGIDGVGAVIPTGASPAAGVAQNAMFTKNGYKYRVRLPYMYDYAGGTSQPDGEWRNTYARLFNVSTNYSDVDQGKFASLAVLGTGSAPNVVGSTPLAPLYSTTVTWHNYPYNPPGMTTDNNASYTWYAQFVFELVLP